MTVGLRQTLKGHIVEHWQHCKQLITFALNQTTHCVYTCTDTYYNCFIGNYSRFHSHPVGRKSGYHCKTLARFKTDEHLRRLSTLPAGLLGLLAAGLKAAGRGLPAHRGDVVFCGHVSPDRLVFESTLTLVGIHGCETAAVGVLSAFLCCGLNLFLGTVRKISGVIVARHCLACGGWLRRVVVCEKVDGCLELERCCCAQQ